LKLTHYRRGESGADECQFTVLPEGVLHGRGELPQLADLAVVDLVERDEQPGPVLGEEIGDELDLAAERRFGSVAGGCVPGEPA